jgi:hypothetical protein
MSTVASLQIKVGADVTAAISGLSKSEFAANKVAAAYESMSEKSIAGSFAIAGAASKVADIAGAVQSKLSSINLDKLTDSAGSALGGLSKVVNQTLRLSEGVAAASSVFSTLSAVAGPALASIAGAIPSISVGLSALAGPIGIAIAGAGALAAGFLAMEANAGAYVSKQGELIEQMRTERSIALGQLEVIKSGNLSYKERGEAIDIVNEKYGLNLKNLKDEGDLVAQVDLAYQDLTASIENKIKVSALQEKIEGLIRERLAVEDLAKTYDSFGKGAKSNPVFSQLTPGQQEQFGFDGAKQGALAQAASLKDQVTPLINELSDLQLFEGKDKSKGSGRAKAAQTDADKIKEIYNQVFKDIAVIQLQLDKGLIPAGTDVTLQKLKEIEEGVKGIGQLDINSPFIDKLVEVQKGLATKATVSAPEQLASLSLPTSIERDPKNVQKDIDKIAKNLKPIPLKLEIPGEQVKKIASTIQQVASIASQIGGQLQDLFAGNSSAQIAAIDSVYERERLAIEASLGSNALKAQKLKELDEKTAKERRAIQRKEAQAQKAAGIFSAIISTAQGIASALATGPAGIPLAAIIGALGGAQVAAIASQPLPALAQGGLLYGPSAVLAGEYPGAQANPEVISPLDKLQKYIRQAVSDGGGNGGQLSTVVSNDDLVFLINRGQYRSTRLR